MANASRFLSVGGNSPASASSRAVTSSWDSAASRAPEPVNAPREAGFLQVQQPSQFRHADRTLEERAEELCLLGGEIAAAADIRKDMRHQLRQPYQRVGEPWLPGCRGHGIP